MTWNYKLEQSHTPTQKVLIQSTSHMIKSWKKAGLIFLTAADDGQRHLVVSDMWHTLMAAGAGQMGVIDKSVFDHRRRGNSSVQRWPPHLSTTSSHPVWSPMIFTSQAKSYMLTSHNAEHQVTWADFMSRNMEGLCLNTIKKLQLIWRPFEGMHGNLHVMPEWCSNQIKQLHVLWLFFFIFWCLISQLTNAEVDDVA